MREVVRKKGGPVTLLVAWALALSFAAIPASEPFAPKVTPPEKLDNRDMWLNMINQWKIPNKETVGVPAYPGAQVVAWMGASTMGSNGEKTATLPAMTLATEDDQAKVTAFYKKELADWSYKNSFDMFDVFWTGVDEFDNLDIGQAMTIPNLTIMEAAAPHTDFMPTAKTVITIVYKPSGTKAKAEKAE